MLDLVLTNVPDLCNVHVHGNVGRSDHASLGVALNLSPAVAGFDVARRVPLKSRVNWNAVCEALSGLNWRSVFRSPTMVRDFDREVSRIMERFVPMVTVRRRGGDAAWFDGDCRRAFELKQSAYHRWCRNRSAENWDLFCQARGTANRLYAAAKARYSADCRRNLDDCASANAWWSTLKGHVFGAESDIPPLCSPGGALVSDPAGKAESLSTWFDSKQSRDIVELPQTCHPRPAFCGIAFRAREVERYLLDLDPNGGVDPSGCFPMFFQKTVSVLAPKLSCLFRRLLRGGEFPLEWRIADVTPIPKGPLSALVCNYRPISITPVLSKVFERLIALRFGCFLERSGVLPSHQYSYRKRLGTCDALLDIVCAGQLELDRGGELALVQIDFSAAFDRVNHEGLVFKLREAGVGGLILRVFQNFLSSRTQRVKVDGVFSSSIDVVSGVPQGSVLGPLLFLLYIADLPRLLQNELVGYADDSTLLCRIPHPRDRSSVAASLNEDLAVISNWCSRWGMLVNSSKTRGMLISRSRTVEPSFPDLLIDGSVVEMVSELKILGVIIDFKLSFEKQVRAIAASASMRVGILRKTMSVFRDVTVVAKCFWAFILPVLEYCSPVWMSAATSHLSLLDRVVSQVGRLSGGSVSCDLWHRRRVASVSAFFKIDSLVDHPVRGLFPAQYVLRRPTRGALAAHSRSFEMPRSRTVQFSRSFVLSCVRLWNGLHESVFAGEGLGAFKTSVNRFLLQG